MTTNSRAHPEILKVVRYIFQAKILNLSSEAASKKCMILDLLIGAIKTGYVAVSLYYMAVLEVRKMLISLNINPENF